MLLAVAGRLHKSVPMAGDCPPGEQKAYRDAISAVGYGLMKEVLEPLYAVHPSLKPPDWPDDSV